MSGVFTPVSLLFWTVKDGCALFLEADENGEHHESVGSRGNIDLSLEIGVMMWL